MSCNITVLFYFSCLSLKVILNLYQEGNFNERIIKILRIRNIILILMALKINLNFLKKYKYMIQEVH